MLQIAKIDTTNAAVALPVSSAIIRVLETPNLSDEELEIAIRNADSNAINVFDTFLYKSNTLFSPICRTTYYTIEQKKKKYV